MTPLNYLEDSIYALPGECTRTMAISHEDFYLMSDEGQRDRCAYCHLPFHSSVINIANRREEKRPARLQQPTEYVYQSNEASALQPVTYCGSSTSQTSFPYTPYAPNPIGMGQHTGYTNQSIALPTNLPATYHDPAMSQSPFIRVPSIHSIGEGHTSLGPGPFLFNPIRSEPTAGSMPTTTRGNAPEDSEKGYMDTKTGYHLTKKGDANKSRPKLLTAASDLNTVWLSIEWVSCQYYVTHEGTEEVFELGQEKSRCESDLNLTQPPFRYPPFNFTDFNLGESWVKVPRDRPYLKLTTWLQILRNHLPGPQRRTVLNAASAIFCDRIQRSKSKNQDQPLHVEWLHDYESLTIRDILADGGMPWWPKKDRIRKPAYQAFIIIYRERINPPATQGRLASPYRSSPGPSQSATAQISRDEDLDNDPFWDDPPSYESCNPTSRSRTARPRRALSNSSVAPLQVRKTPRSLTSPRGQSITNASSTNPPMTSRTSSFVDLTGARDSDSDTESSLSSVGHILTKWANDPSKRGGKNCDQEKLTTQQEGQADPNTSLSRPNSIQSPTRQPERLYPLPDSQSSDRSPIGDIGTPSAREKALSPAEVIPEPPSSSHAGVADGSSPITHGYNTRRRLEASNSGYYGKLASGQ
ncbi:hypothetical protein F4776DRAFT_631187 [Hypoxylon sp. NC0597]|nr:hypothetical protein F4776DRAFT_631187 [Hypoxylon sp. NC0597]